MKARDGNIRSPKGRSRKTERDVLSLFPLSFDQAVGAALSTGKAPPTTKRKSKEKK